MQKWLLAIALVLGQTVLLAHQTDLDAHSGSPDHCEVCHVASGMDGVSKYASIQAIKPVCGQNHLPAISPALYRPFSYLPRTRAPPVNHVTDQA